MNGSDATPEEHLHGGGSGVSVSRVGDVVLRARGPWSKRVEELLVHLKEVGYQYSPTFLGIAPDGRQRLDYLPGEVGNYPLTAAVRSDTALVTAARLLRQFHDATADIAPSMLDGWMLPAVEPVEVICHGDFATYNCVFDGEVATGIIDFDAAHPGPRIRDVAYAVYRFAPLSVQDGTGPDVLSRQGRRARLFCDTYGLTDRSGLLAAVVRRLQDLLDFMYREAAEGNAAFAGNIEAGHADLYRADIAYVEQNSAALGSHMQSRDGGWRARTSAARRDQTSRR